MSDFGIFEAADQSEGEARLAQRDDTMVLDRAIHAVREQFPHLAGATSKEDYDDRVMLCKNDMMKVVAEHVFPKPAIMRKVVSACKPKSFKKTALEFMDDPRNHGGQNPYVDHDPTEQQINDDYDGIDDLMRRGPLAKKTAGAQVGGQANIGDLVTYYDMSNQTGEIWEVIALPNDASNIGPTGYIMKDYGLSSLSDERKHWSDLRQQGWTFFVDNGVDFNTLATRKRADTTVDPQHLPDHFDDEGNRTSLDDAGRDTAPRDASRTTAGTGGPAADALLEYMRSAPVAEIGVQNVVWNYVESRGGAPSMFDALMADIENIVWDYVERKHGAPSEFDALMRTADQDKKNKALIPKKDWDGYLRDRAADGKKVRKNNFASKQAAAARDFPELFRSANEDPKEINPEPSGSDAYHRSEDMESLDPDKVETQPKDASRKTAATGYICKECGGPSPMGVGYAADGEAAERASEGLTSCACGYSQKPTTSSNKTASVEQALERDGWKITWNDHTDGDGYILTSEWYESMTDNQMRQMVIHTDGGSRGYDWTLTQAGSTIASGNTGWDLQAAADQVHRALRDSMGVDGYDLQYGASRKRADTTVDPQPLPSDFDDEGGRTSLDDAGRETQPKDAALHAAWAKASAKGMNLADFAAFNGVSVAAVRKVAAVPFV